MASRPDNTSSSHAAGGIAFQVGAVLMMPGVATTTSSAERDIQECYDSGANSYIIKPVELENFVEAVTRLRDYWFKIVILPKVENGLKL